MGSAPGATTRPDSTRARRTIVLFLLLAALLPGLTAVIATGLTSYYGTCRWTSRPDPIVCNAG